MNSNKMIIKSPATTQTQIMMILSASDNPEDPLDSIAFTCFTSEPKNEFAPPGLKPGSSDCRSDALPLSYRVRQVFTAYVAPL